jgi:hypothetical protein
VALISNYQLQARGGGGHRILSSSSVNDVNEKINVHTQNLNLHDQIKTKQSDDNRDLQTHRYLFGNGGAQVKEDKLDKI